MEILLEKISDLNDMILQGKTLDAFEKYYHEDVQIKENDGQPTIGKHANRKREKKFFGNISNFRSANPLKVTVGENCTMVQWHYDYVHKEWGERNYVQVSVQDWQDGKIIG